MNTAAGTSPGERDPFAALREEHARVLERLAAFERELARTGTPGEAQVRALVADLGAPFAAHLAAEEDVLYPAMAAAFAGGPAVIAPLLGEREELRAMLASLERWLAQPGSAERDEQVAVVLRDLLDLLRLHIRREETSVLDVAARVLSAAAAGELARRIASPTTIEPPRDREAPPTKGAQP